MLQSAWPRGWPGPRCRLPGPPASRRPRPVPPRAPAWPIAHPAPPGSSDGALPGSRPCQTETGGASQHNRSIRPEDTTPPRRNTKYSGETRHSASVRRLIDAGLVRVKPTIAPLTVSTLSVAGSQRMGRSETFITVQRHCRRLQCTTHTPRPTTGRDHPESLTHTQGQPTCIRVVWAPPLHPSVWRIDTDPVYMSYQSMEWIEFKRSSPAQIHESLILIQSNPADHPESESSPVQSGHNRVYQIPCKIDM